ncbi:MAG TPA: pyruvate dehydrogenase complex dihydrolipoamide acetyltransferase [Pyrinomonadaceae bacterium]|jgi:pyruvate dehydrogenase E2 component (dihydrolipoamide acetyltransferase)
MATQVVMPKLSPTMEEGQLARWLKKEGDTVSMGEPLAEIDTDKATMEMQSLGNGVLRKILIQEGESAPLGQIIAIIGEADEDISALLSQAQSGSQSNASNKAESAEAAAETGGQGDSGEAAPAEQQGAAGGGAPASPTGNGAGAQSSGDGADAGRLVVSPIAARMAAEAGINLRSLKGSGPSGRIIKRDIEEAMKAGQTQSATKEAPSSHLRVVESAAPAQQPEIFGASPYRDEPTSEIRRVIARRLVTSIGPVPHFFLTTEIEMDNVAQMRSSIKALDPSLKISVNDIIIKVAAAALIQHPQVNASFQEKTIRYYERADIGVAVAIEDGLITPVIRSADRKSLSEIASEVRELAERARTRRLKPEEYTGATFSISNLGMFGITEFTAVINPPEAAILAVGEMKPEAVVRDGQVTVRQIMRVTMSCDHRVIDGATGAQFLQTFKRILENPLYLIV